MRVPLYGCQSVINPLPHCPAFLGTALKDDSSNTLPVLTITSLQILTLPLSHPIMKWLLKYGLVHHENILQRLPLSVFQQIAVPVSPQYIKKLSTGWKDSSKLTLTPSFRNKCFSWNSNSLFFIAVSPSSAIKTSSSSSSSIISMLCFAGGFGAKHELSSR